MTNLDGCLICGDVDDHDGLSHAAAVKDGKTRADVADDVIELLIAEVLDEDPGDSLDTASAIRKMLRAEGLLRLPMYEGRR